MALQMVYLVLGTIAAILFLVKSMQGQKYGNLVENLDSKDFPLKSIYCVGFAWSANPTLALNGKTREKLVGQAKLLYDYKYAEYYANVVWAQTLSVIHLFLTLAFLLAGIMNSTFIFVVMLAATVMFGYYFLGRMNSLLKTRAEECTEELPEIVSTMALLINSGMVVRQAWHSIAESREGTVYELMRQSCAAIDNGMAELDAIHSFGRMSNSPEVRKFTGALAQSIERGGGELDNFLARQSIEIWTLKKQTALQKGEAAASKLLAPTAMLFIGIIIIVITGAIGMLI